MSVAYGCEKEGPAEKAGKKIDQAIDKAGDTLKELGEKVKDQYLKPDQNYFGQADFMNYLLFFVFVFEKF